MINGETDTSIVYQCPDLPTEVMVSSDVADRCFSILQASGGRHLKCHKQQVVLRVTHEDIQFDTYEIATTDPD
ncbi:hypothetical protein PS943_03161 [Pseudomonas fluorescens]|uniref:Uncharacterized protein n=1 Tax=Pseudomonas fluorescens TaxID=294 RepID=A0A5E7WD76_PSEFL|nr:hypothetical protein PS943_03161 [Pseudomonas fluorescens]